MGDAHRPGAGGPEGGKEGLGRSGVQRGKIGHLYQTQGQHMAVEGGDLHTRQQREIVPAPADGLVYLGVTRYGVVVGESQHPESLFGGVGGELFGSQGAVRLGGMVVQFRSQEFHSYTPSRHRL